MVGGDKWKVWVRTCHGGECCWDGEERLKEEKMVPLAIVNDRKIVC